MEVGEGRGSQLQLFAVLSVYAGHLFLSPPLPFFNEAGKQSDSLLEVRPHYSQRSGTAGLSGGQEAGGGPEEGKWHP